MHSFLHLYPHPTHLIWPRYLGLGFTIHLHSAFRGWS